MVSLDSSLDRLQSLLRYPGGLQAEQFVIWILLCDVITVEMDWRLVSGGQQMRWTSHQQQIGFCQCACHQVCSALDNRVIVDGLRETIEERQMRLPMGNNCSEWIAINCTHECTGFGIFCCSLIPTDWYCNFIAAIYCEPRITTGCSANANYSATGNCLIAHMICIIPTIVWI